MTEGHTRPDQGSLAVACSLAADQLADRLAAWNDALAYLTSRSELPDGLQIVFQDRPGLAELLASLARLEQECCPWMELAVSAPPPTMTVTAAGAGVAVVRRMFAGED